MRNANHETIADIIEEKRSVAQYIRENNDTLIGRMDALKLEEEAGRIESAWKREREAGAEAAQVCGEIGEMIGREAACKQCNRFGNAAKMREACDNIAEYAKAAACHTEDAHLLGYLNQIERWAEAALSAQPRNCDVGTAEEQAERFAEYCDSEACKRNRCKSRAKALYIERCAIAWAQMPYEEGESK